MARLSRLSLILTMSAVLTFIGSPNTVHAVAAAPVASSINPLSGPNTGTSNVIVFGSGFQSGLTVTFGSVAAVVNSVSPSQIDVNAPALPNGFGTVLVLVTNPDHTTSHENLFYRYFEQLPAGAAASLAAVSNPSQPARMDVFITGTDNALYHSYSANNDTNWTGWEGLGGTLTSAPSAVSWQDGQRIDIFARGTDNALWHRWWTGTGWGGWEGLGGGLKGAPVVTTWGPGRLDVFVRGTDDQLWHKWWDGARWSGWEPLGGVLSSDPGGVSWGPPDRRVGTQPALRIDVFVLGTDNGIWHRWFDRTSWSGWEGLGVPSMSLASAPAVSATEIGDLEVFALGSDASLMHFPYFGGWLGWRSEGIAYPAWSPNWKYGVGTVAASVLQGVDVFVVAGVNGRVWHTGLHGASEGFGAQPRSRPR